MVDRRREIEPVDPADHLVHRAKAQLRHVLAHLLRHEAEEGRDELGRAREPLSELGILGGDAHWTGVQVANPHHDAAHHYQGRGREAVLLGAQQSGDHDVSAGFHLSVHLHHDPIAQLVEH